MLIDSTREDCNVQSWSSRCVLNQAPTASSSIKLLGPEVTCTALDRAGMNTGASVLAHGPVEGKSMFLNTHDLGFDIYTRRRVIVCF
jgi:hypothetical protein